MALAVKKDNDFSGVCRVCAERTNAMSEIFHTCLNGLLLSDMMQSCLQKTISIDDGLPSSICIGCIDNLVTAYKFCALCLNSEKQFRKLITNAAFADNNTIKEEGVDPLLNIAFEETSIKIESAESRKREIKEEDCQELHPPQREKCSGKQFECFDCKEPIENVTKLRRHLAIVHRKKQKVNKHKVIKLYHCSVCNKKFQYGFTLENHMRIHSGETPYLCSECGKSFKSSSTLRQHSLRHKRPFRCEECPKQFGSRAGLNSHMISHSGQRPHVCDICGSSFTASSSLVKHKRIHTGERPYACEMCNMRFNSSDHVKRHKRVHTGERPYKCKFCDRAFAQSNDLVKHTRSHVGECTYQCEQCPKAFRLQKELRLHSQMHYLEQKRQLQCNENTSTLESNIRVKREEETIVRDDTSSPMEKCSAEKRDSIANQ